MSAVAKRLLVAYAAAIGLGLASAWAYAQGVIVVQPVAPTVIAGPDVGFRMTGRKGDTPVGQLVVRVQGEWKAVEFAAAVK